jgi:stage II sporulation protein D
VPVPRLVAAALVGVAATASGVVATGSSAAAADSWAVPRSAHVVVPGHGYGHGHGMSQYGAEGAARRGLTHSEILDFYYPGTKRGEVRGRISVLLTGDTSDDLVVEAEPGLSVRSLGEGRTWQLPDNGADLWRLLPRDGGRTQVQFFEGGRWQGWRRFDGDGQVMGGGGTLDLVTPSGTTTYRGILRSAAPKPGGLARDTVNVVRLEAYLRGVVPREIPATWSAQAVRAQAVAARTYAAFERRTPRGSHFQVYDTTASQVYGGADAEHEASDRAIRATRREVRVHDGKPAFTQFSSSNGGWTSKGSVPYLTAKPDPYDGWDGNPNHDWRVRFTDRTIEHRWPALGNLRRIAVTGRDGNGEWGGRVESLVLRGSRNDVRMSGDDFRYRLGLRSTWFTLRVRER